MNSAFLYFQQKSVTEGNPCKPSEIVTLYFFIFKMYFYVGILTTLWLTLTPACAQNWLRFEDIPIENYDHIQREEDTIDGGELLPRLSRSPDSADSDPKEAFFRYMRAYNGDFDEDSDAIDVADENIPKPGGLNVFYKAPIARTRSRQRRNTKKNNTAASKEAEIIPEAIEDSLGKSIEPAILASTIDTEKSDLVEATITATEETADENVPINDFIRFRRSNVDSKEQNPIHSSSNTTNNHSDENSRPKRDHMHNSHSEKLQMNPDRFEMETMREPRGAIREQWVKQPYPVEHREDSYEDNSAAASDKAPRVHFVTQRRSESASSPLLYGNFERDGRSRDLTRDPPVPAPARDEVPTGRRDPVRDVRTPLKNVPARDYDRFYQPRYTRNYNPYSPMRQRFEPYYYFDEQERYHNPRLENNYYPDRNRYTSYSANKQRRIIYYATLPEVVRTPPNVDLRDRYNYRDRYDDTFLNSPLNPIDSFRFRKPYPKSRYEEDIGRPKGQAPYPLKVSTDVNVRETKKNPERRIYSEVDRNRYGYKAPHYSQAN